jgi:cytochrome oxidase Cu insertion factor (SCO1/SenC/PrrC family)
MQAVRRIRGRGLANRVFESLLSKAYICCPAGKGQQLAEVPRGFATLSDAAGRVKNSPHSQQYLNYGLAAAAGAGAVYLLTRGRGREGEKPSLVKEATDSASKLATGEGHTSKPQYNPKLADVKPFKAVDHTGQPFTHDDLLGDFVVVIFGDPNSSLADRQFDKLAGIITDVDQKTNMQYTVPLFVAIEPDKTDAAAIKKFVDKHVSDFASRKSEGRTGFKGVTGPELIHLKDAVLKSVDGYFTDLKQLVAVLDPEGKVTGVFNEKKDPSQLSDEVAAQIRSFRQKHPMWHYPKGVKERTA